jgi:hypothetical protein
MAPLPAHEAAGATGAPATSMTGHGPTREIS